MDPDWIGKRVDIVVMELHPELSRASIKKLMAKGLITVNDQEVFANYRIQQGDQINISRKQLKDFFEDEPVRHDIKPKKMDLEVLYEDEDIIAVNKPEGVNSHPANRRDNNSVLNGLFHHEKEQSGVLKKIRLVHRLDKDTSGVLLGAKNIPALDFYSEQFQNRTVYKEYNAIVKGDFEAYLIAKKMQNAYVSTFMSQLPNKERQYFNTTARAGRVAKTSIYFQSHFNKFGKKKFSLLKIVPETGRTHQIRLHLATIGFPILGDRLYGGQKYKRLMLHAHRLTVTMQRDRDNELELIAPLPEKFLWD